MSIEIETPPHYTYFTVTGRYLRRVIDGPDDDRNPDVEASVGSFKFVPRVSEFKDLSIPATFSNLQQTGSLDPSGYLVDEQGRPGVVLMSGNSPHISPQGWTWTVTPTINGKSGASFDLPADIPPGETVDLTVVAPAAASGGTVIIVSEASRLAAEEARDQAVEAAESLAVGLEGAIEAYFVENPPVGGGGNVDSVNGKVGAVTLTAADVSAVPVTRTVAGKPLTSDVTLAKTDVGLSNVDNTSDSGKPISAATQTALNAKAAASHTHVVSQVTDLEAYVTSRITDIVGSAPSALDTLDELAAALGDDANFAATVTSSLAGKASTTHSHTTSQVTDFATATDGRINTLVPTASATVQGKVELATTAEALTGTDTTRAVTAAGVKAVADTKVGSPNTTITGLAYYPTLAELPATGTTGVIYFVDVV